MAGVVNRAELARQIADARGSLVVSLRALPIESWEAPSLCDAWAVRDVVGHLLHQYDLYRVPYPGVALARVGFRVNRFLAQEARRRAEGVPPAELLDGLGRAEFERTVVWRVNPRPQFALSELVIHAQDIRRAVGLPGSPEMSHLMVIGGVFAKSAWGNPFRRALPPTRFEATDTGWSWGEGPVVRGPLEAIVMVMAGRGQALRDLRGEGVDGLAAVLV